MRFLSGVLSRRLGVQELAFLRKDCVFSISLMFSGSLMNAVWGYLKYGMPDGARRLPGQWQVAPRLQAAIFRQPARRTAAISRRF